MRIEELKFDDYMSDPAQYQREADLYWSSNRVWIEKELKNRGWVWCVVCGQQLIAGSSNSSDFPDEDEKVSLGQQHNLIPFAFHVAVPPEESSQVQIPNHLNPVRRKIQQRKRHAITEKSRSRKYGFT